MNGFEQETKTIRIILEENEDILESIKKAMQKNSVEAMRIYSGDGTIREGKINCCSEDSFEAKQFSNGVLIGVTGKFNKNAKNYLGNLRVQVKIGTLLLSGSLLEGKAKDGLVFRARFR